MRDLQQHPCLQLFYDLSINFLRTLLIYPSAVLTPLSPILEFHRKVLLGTAEFNMILKGQPKKIHHEVVYPDRHKSLHEFLQLEDILNEDEESITIACICTFSLVFLYIFKVCFQEKEHVIFYILWKDFFFRLFSPKERE